MSHGNRVAAAMVCSAIVASIGLAPGCGGGSKAPATGLPPPHATPAGTPLGAAVTTIIGAAGGTIVASDQRLTLAVPPGALAKDISITVQPLTGTAPGARGNAYRLTPEGQRFQKPVALTFPYADADLAGTVPEALGAAFQSSDGYWHWLRDPVVDATARTVTVSTDHFSDYAPVAAFGLRAAGESVEPGKAMKVSGYYCYMALAAPDDPELSTRPGIDCGAGLDPNALVPVVGPIEDWTVDGVPGGDGAVGTVTGTGLTGTYIAPSSPPSRPVVVAGRIRHGRGNSATIARRVRVGGGGGPTSYAGTVSITGSYSAGGTTRWLVADMVLTLAWDGSSFSSIQQASLTMARVKDVASDCTWNGPAATAHTGLQTSLGDFPGAPPGLWTLIIVVYGEGLNTCVEPGSGNPLDPATWPFQVPVECWGSTAVPWSITGSCDYRPRDYDTGSGLMHVAYDLVGR